MCSERTRASVFRLMQMSSSGAQGLWSFIVALACLTSTAATAQPSGRLSAARDSAIDQAIDSTMRAHKIPAVSISIIRAGAIVLERSYGVSDLEHSVAATNETLYRIASLSKPITAVAVMQVVGQGKIDLDAPIQQYVPSFPRHAQPIAVRQLLTHTSGIRHYKNAAEFNTTRHCEELSEGLTIFQNDSLVHAPGEKITYSTYGFVLLGVALENEAKQDFVEYLHERIFTPAGMSRTRQDLVYDIIPNRARGYTVDDSGELRNPELVDTSCRIPGGGLLSTAGDLARFLIALDSGKLLAPDGVAQMFANHITPEQIQRTVAGQEVPEGYVFPGFGFGWAIHTQKHENVRWHGGNQQGATSMIYWLPDERLGIAILTNLGEQGAVLTSLADHITSVIVP